jgi:hypothetical protein
MGILPMIHGLEARATLGTFIYWPIRGARRKSPPPESWRMRSAVVERRMDRPVPVLLKSLFFMAPPPMNLRVSHYPLFYTVNLPRPRHPVKGLFSGGCHDAQTGLPASAGRRGALQVLSCRGHVGPARCSGRGKPVALQACLSELVFTKLCLLATVLRRLQDKQDCSLRLCHGASRNIVLSILVSCLKTDRRPPSPREVQKAPSPRGLRAGRPPRDLRGAPSSGSEKPLFGEKSAPTSSPSLCPR